MNYRNKKVWYVRPLDLEIQYGRLSGSVVLWWRGRRYIVRKAQR